MEWIRLLIAEFCNERGVKHSIIRKTTGKTGPVLGPSGDIGLQDFGDFWVFCFFCSVLFFENFKSLFCKINMITNIDNCMAYSCVYIILALLCILKSLVRIVLSEQKTTQKYNKNTDLRHFTKVVQFFQQSTPSG